MRLKWDYNGWKMRNWHGSSLLRGCFFFCWSAQRITLKFLQCRTVSNYFQQIEAPEILDDKIDAYFKWAKGSNKAREALPGSVLDIPSIEIVLHPAEVLRKICKFLGIICTEKYLQDCADTVDPTPSITRDYVKWTTKQKERVNTEMKRFTFLQGFSFDKTV